MISTKRLALLMTLALAVGLVSVAFAQTQFAVQTNLFGGMVVTTDRTLANSTNRTTRILRGLYTLDFASSTILCVDSAAQTLTGARADDVCVVSSTAVSTANASYSCRVNAANQVTIRFCPAGTLADPASGTFQVMVVSNAI
jgi:hypothetical protein